MDENLLKCLGRLKNSYDGIEFIEFLKTLSNNNYIAWKLSPHEFNDIHKGQAVALDGILEEFNNCEEKLKALNENDSNQIDYNPEHNPNF